MIFPIQYSSNAIASSPLFPRSLLLSQSLSYFQVNIFQLLYFSEHAVLVFLCICFVLLNTNTSTSVNFVTNGRILFFFLTENVALYNVQHLYTRHTCITCVHTHLQEDTGKFCRLDWRTLQQMTRYSDSSGILFPLEMGIAGRGKQDSCMTQQIYFQFI